MVFPRSEDGCRRGKMLAVRKESLVRWLRGWSSPPLHPEL